MSSISTMRSKFSAKTKKSAAQDQALRKASHILSNSTSKDESFEHKYIPAVEDLMLPLDMALKNPVANIEHPCEDVLFQTKYALPQTAGTEASRLPRMKRGLLHLMKLVYPTVFHLRYLLHPRTDKKNRTNKAPNDSSLALKPIPVAALLSDVMSPAEFVANIPDCNVTYVNSDEFDILNDLQLLYYRASELAAKMPVAKGVGSITLGYSLINLGVLRNDPQIILSGITELTRLYGPGGIPTIQSQLILVDSLIERADYTCQYSGNQKDVLYISEAEHVLRDTITVVLNIPDCSNTRLWELRALVAKMNVISTIYSKLPTSRKEHECRHYLADVLPPVLGSTHLVMIDVYDSLQRYYTEMARRRDNLTATLAALMTAVKYALLWIEAAVNSPKNIGEPKLTPSPLERHFITNNTKGDSLTPQLTNFDIIEEVASHLVLFSDEIIRPLWTAGGPAEREAAWSAFTCISAIIDDTPLLSSGGNTALNTTSPNSSFSKCPITVFVGHQGAVGQEGKITAALRAIDGIFKSNLKIVEESEKKVPLLTQIEECSKEMHAAVSRVRRHKNRLDHYSVMQSERVMKMGVKVRRLIANVKDEDIIEKGNEVLQYHDTVLKVHNQQIIKESENSRELLATGRAKSLTSEHREIDGSKVSTEGQKSSSKKGLPIGSHIPSPTSCYEPYKSPYRVLTCPIDIEPIDSDDHKSTQIDTNRHRMDTNTPFLSSYPAEYTDQSISRNPKKPARISSSEYTSHLPKSGASVSLDHCQNTPSNGIFESNESPGSNSE